MYSLKSVTNHMCFLAYMGFCLRFIGLLIVILMDTSITVSILYWILICVVHADMFYISEQM